MAVEIETTNWNFKWLVNLMDSPWWLGVCSGEREGKNPGRLHVVSECDQLTFI